MERIQRILLEISHLDLKDRIIDTQLHAASFGASSDVYSAWSTRHEKKVAVKRIRVFLTKEEAFMKRLAKEIRIWSRLDHENVLPLLGFITEGEDMIPSLMSEWMVKGTLQEYMKTVPRCGIEACRLLVGIASGLAYLHSRRIIHADLNSRNILISVKKTPLLTDFGLSLALTQSQTTVGTTASTRGTMRWMAKELFLTGPNSHVHDEMTDIWAFGMVAYELLSLQLPFWNMKADVFVMAAIVSGMIPEKPSRRGVVSRQIFDEIWKLCRSCWTDRNSSNQRPRASEITSTLRDVKEMRETQLLKKYSAYDSNPRYTSWDHEEDETLEEEDEEDEPEEEICAIALAYSESDDPELQSLAFRTIVLNSVARSSFRHKVIIAFKDGRASGGASSLMRHRNSTEYRAGWMCFCHLALLCLIPNPVTDVTARAEWRLEDLLESCRCVSDLILALKIIGENLNVLGDFFKRKGFRDYSFAKLINAIRLRFKVAKDCSPELSSYDAPFDRVVRCVLLENFTSSLIELTSDEADLLSEDETQVVLWKDLFWIFCASRSDIGHKLVPETFFETFWVDGCEWAGKCLEWLPDPGHARLRKLLIQQEDAYGDLAQRHYPPRLRAGLSNLYESIFTP